MIRPRWTLQEWWRKQLQGDGGPADPRGAAQSRIECQLARAEQTLARTGAERDRRRVERLQRALESIEH
jgi:hypothetical protein